MKKIIKTGLALMAAVIVFSGYTDNKAMAQSPTQAVITYQTFYDDLSPYGTWIDYPEYGHIWHPRIIGEFRPYLTNGYWKYSNEGWMWMSNYSWGWAPFHYGRWKYDDMYGWLWIPGYEWSPAWVTWGSVDNFYAWAPLMPEVYVGIQFGFWKPAAQYWNICDRSHIYDRNIFNVVEKRDVTRNYINRITIINNFSTTRMHNQYYSKGPEINEVERFTNRKIERASIRATNNRLVTNHQGNEIQVYKPSVNNPQPRVFRRFENINTNPAINNQDKVNNWGNQHNENVDRLPVHNAFESSPGNGNRNGGNKVRGNRRN